MLADFVSRNDTILWDLLALRLDIDLISAAWHCSVVVESQPVTYERRVESKLADFVQCILSRNQELTPQPRAVSERHRIDDETFQAMDFVFQRLCRLLPVAQYGQRGLRFCCFPL